jgi:transposase
MAKPILDDELWVLIESLLPAPKPRRFRYPGRKPIGNREALTGILFVLISGIPWEMLPQELGCGSGMSCWRRLRDWTSAGVWQKIHSFLLDRLREADKIDWSRAVIDSASVRAVFGGIRPARTPQIGPKRAASIMS